MHHLKGHDVEVTDAERLVLVNLVQLDGGNTRIAMLGEAVRQHFQHTTTCYGVGIDVDFAKLTVRAHIVHTTHVVVVGMGNQDTVNASEDLWHDLLAEIRSAVYQQPRVLGF